MNDEMKPPSDLLFTNCTVLAPGGARTAAVALRGAKVLGVGSEEELRARLAPNTRIIDADSAFLMPAFHDAHVHLTQHGFELGQVDLQTAATLEEGVARVAARAAELPAGSWILGAGFALQRWGVEALDRQTLDRVSPSHPVLLRSQDHHSAWANSRALQVAGVSGSTPDSADGSLVRDETGEPTGLLLERALHLVWDIIPEPSREEIRSAVQRGAADLASRGIATVHHMAYEPASYWREIALAASEHDFPLRVWACIDQEQIEHTRAIGLATGQGGPGFTIGGAKFFADGALGSRTAWMLEPYSGTNEVGVAVHGPEVLAERYPLAIESGLTPVTHAIGDAAVRAVIDALEATAPAWQARGLRPRIEHVQHLAAEDVPRLAALGVVVSMQPIHLTFDVQSISSLLFDRQERAYRMRELLAAGVQLALGSDTPVAPPDVTAGLRAACRRQGSDGTVLCAEQALGVDEALAGYTSGAAYAIGREGRSGQLRPGYDADLVLLSHDPREALDGLTVRATLKGGLPTFDPEGLLQSGYTPA